MAQTISNVAAASPVATGGVLWAPLGTPLPTTAVASLDAAFKPLGYVSDEGIGDNSDAAPIDDIFAWGGDNVASLQTTGSVKRYTFKLIELFNEDVANFLYGDSNVTPTAATVSVGEKLAILDKADTIAPGILLFDMKFEGKKKRIVCPNANPVISGEDPLVHTAISGTEITATCKKDDTGVRQYIYLQNDVLADA